MSDVLPRLHAALADRYRLERELGQGGMATVYLAHDIRHERDVAIKVLHPDLGAALGSERFLTEIRTTAKLQHPHILPLLDSGEADGLLYYVMPLVTGETLRTRLERERQLPIPDAVRIAREVASALDYAHRQGVIHRDIKPENILLHDGQALVADFGIALAVQTAGGARMTQTGLSLGTPHYMSPEQAMGEKQIDARTDVYALGAVTYEMLVGEPPFTGATVQAIVAKVMTERPTAPHAIRDTVPPKVEHATLTALAKLPADRFATAAEFAAALVNPTTATIASFAPVRPALRGNRPALIFASAAIVLAAVAAWGWLGRTPAATPRPIVKMGVTVQHNISSLSSSGGMAISRDGSQFAYVSSDFSPVPRLYVRGMDDLNATLVSGTLPVWASAFSPDGASIAFLSRGNVMTVPTRGGTPRSVAALQNVVALSWGEDSSIVLSTRRALLRVDPRNGHVDTLAVQALSGATFGAPTFATRELILLSISGDTATNGLAAFSLKTRKLTRLGITGTRPMLVNGHILVYVTTDGTIWGTDFDPQTLKTAGSARPIGDQVSVSAFGVARIAIAPNGTIMHAVGARNDQRELVLVDRMGRARDIGGAQRAYRFPRFSPTGTQIAITLERSSNVRTGNIFVLGLGGGIPLRLTNDSSSFQAEWDPDGRSLIYVQAESLGASLYRVGADGSGAPPIKLLTRPNPIFESRITPDHKTLIWREDNPATLRDILSVPLDSVDSIQRIAATSFDEKGLAMSPDGQWLAYVSNETESTDQVFVRRLEPNSPRWAVSQHGGTEPRWSRTGEIFFRKGDSVFVSRVTLGAVPRFTTPVALFAGAYAATRFEPLWDVAPDGKTFAMVRVPGSEDLQLVLLMNWAEHWRDR